MKEWFKEAWRHWKFPITVLILLFTMLVTHAFQLPAPPSKYAPTEVQRLKMELAAKDVQIAKMQYVSAVNALTSLGDQIRAENKWPEDVQLDLSTMTFIERKAPEPKK
jgi:hypothetical protein